MSGGIIFTISLSGPFACPAWSGSSKYNVTMSGLLSSGSVNHSNTVSSLSGNPIWLWKQKSQDM